MILNINSNFNKITINSAEKAFKVFVAAYNTLDALDKEKEHFFVMGLKRNHHIKFLDITSVGILSGTLVHAREVYIRAIVNSTNSIIVAHNHPSGNMKPSSNDDKLTKSLKEAGKIIGIQLLDHLIFCDNEFYSYAENGNL